jgi:hypothetical protein
MQNHPTHISVTGHHRTVAKAKLDAETLGLTASCGNRPWRARRPASLEKDGECAGLIAVS